MTVARRSGHRPPPGLAPVLEEVSRRADWRRISRLYQQLSQIKAEPRDRAEPPADLTGGLAEALARTFASYEEAEEIFLADLMALFGVIDGIAGDERDRFRYLYKDEDLDAFGVYRPAGGARRRPKPFEAAVETARRISDLNQIRDALSELPNSAILGGSLSYGRFFNTLGGAGGGRASDIDLLVIVPDYDLCGVTRSRVPASSNTSCGSGTERSIRAAPTRAIRSSSTTG